MDNDEKFTELVAHLQDLSGNKNLEKRALAFARNPLVPEPTQQLIKDLWNAYSDSRWVSELLWEKLNVNHE